MQTDNGVFTRFILFMAIAIPLSVYTVLIGQQGLVMECKPTETTTQCAVRVADAIQ